MGAQFESLKAKLREAGCEVLTDNQFKAGNGSLANLLRVYARGADRPVRCLVIDMGADGYRLFTEPDTIKIEDDVALLSGRDDK